MLLNVALVAQSDDKPCTHLLGQYAVFAGVQQDCVQDVHSTTPARREERTTLVFVVACPGYAQQPGAGSRTPRTPPKLKTFSTHGTTSTYPHMSAGSHHLVLDAPPVAAVSTAMSTATGITRQDHSGLDVLKGQFLGTRDSCWACAEVGRKYPDASKDVTWTWFLTR